MIETIECKVCGDVVMNEFLPEHMLYVHGAGSSSQKASKRKLQSEKPSSGLKPQAPKNKKRTAHTSPSAQKEAEGTQTSRGRRKKAADNLEEKMTDHGALVAHASNPPITSGTHEPYKFKRKPDSRKGSGGVVCILCGKRVPRGKLLEHKQNVHGETMYTHSPARYRTSSLWVQIVQGGLPGLGK